VSGSSGAPGLAMGTALLSPDLLGSDPTLTQHLLFTGGREELTPDSYLLVRRGPEPSQLFFDYAIGRAADLPSIEIIRCNKPNRLTTAGLKGMAEGGIMVPSAPYRTRSPTRSLRTALWQRSALHARAPRELDREGGRPAGQVDVEKVRRTSRIQPLRTSRNAPPRRRASMTPGEPTRVFDLLDSFALVLRFSQANACPSSILIDELYAGIFKRAS
jgi:hypothetical protein